MLCRHVVITTTGSTPSLQKVARTYKERLQNKFKFGNIIFIWNPFEEEGIQQFKMKLVQYVVILLWYSAILLCIFVNNLIIRYIEYVEDVHVNNHDVYFAGF